MTDNNYENENKVEELAPVNLTDWANQPKLTDLKADITEAQSDHSAHVSDVNRWLDNLYITGSAKIKTPKGRSEIVPKLIRKQAEWRYASLSEPFLSTPDLFNVSPVTYEDKAAAEQNELVLNNQFNTKINKVNFIGDYIRTAVNEGSVVCKVSWIEEKTEMEVEQPIYEYVTDRSEAAFTQIQELAQAQQTDPEVFEAMMPFHQKEMLRLSMEENVPVIAKIVETQLVKKVITTKNHPYVEICRYDNVMIDPTCEGDLTKANFIVYSFESSLGDLKKAGIYKNLDYVKVDSSSIFAQSDASTNYDVSTFNFKDKPRTKIMVHEYWGYWDIDNSGIPTSIVVTFVGDTIIRMEKNPYPNGELPFVKVDYLPIPKRVYGEPDGELLEDNQKIVGAVTRGMIDIMGRSANGQIGAAKDALDIVNKRKFINGEDYEYNPNINPERAFHVHKYPEIPQSAAFMLELQNNEAESLTGIKAFHSGISGQALGSTATGVRSALDATSKRDLDILRRLAQGIVEIGRKFIGMNSLFLNEKEVIRITNEKFIEVKRDDLLGNFDLKLTISTAEEDNQKAEELAFMLQTIGNSFDLGLVQMILADIAKLRKMPELAKQIKAYAPQPDPLQQKKMELEIALIEAQIQETLSKAQKNIADSQLNGVKTNTEVAKANNLNSQTDKNDLDFIEQESGVKQLRDLEKQGAQAEAQLNTKVVEHFLKQAENNKQEA